MVHPAIDNFLFTLRGVHQLTIHVKLVFSFVEHESTAHLVLFGSNKQMGSGLATLNLHEFVKFQCLAFGTTSIIFRSLVKDRLHTHVSWLSTGSSSPTWNGGTYAHGVILAFSLLPISP